MINTMRAMKIASTWTAVVYAVCYGGVALFPGIRDAFMQYALHTRVSGVEDVLTLTTFVTGLVIWVLVAAVAAWLFAKIANFYQ